MTVPVPLKDSPARRCRPAGLAALLVLCLAAGAAEHEATAGASEHEGTAGAVPAPVSAAPATAGATALETRCGWLSNPSPGNVSLQDRDGEWLISQQGSYEAQGDWPDFPPAKWVSSGNGSYGYGCACLKVRSDPAQRRILEIASATIKPLSACRRDKRLKAPARD